MELGTVSTELEEVGVVKVRRERYSKKEQSTPATATKTSLLDFQFKEIKLLVNWLKIIPADKAILIF